MAQKTALYAVEDWAQMAEQADYQSWRLAELLKICPRQLRRYTQKLFHCSPRHWLNHQRLLDAAAMLLETDLPVKVVAAQVGFKQHSHFSRQFKLQYNFSPSAFQDAVKLQMPATNVCRRNKGRLSPKMSAPDKRCPF